MREKDWPEVLSGFRNLRSGVSSGVVIVASIESCEAILARLTARAINSEAFIELSLETVKLSNKPLIGLLEVLFSSKTLLLKPLVNSHGR